MSWSEKIDSSKEIKKVMKSFILENFEENLWLILARLLGISVKILNEFYENSGRILEK